MSWLVRLEGNSLATLAANLGSLFVIKRDIASSLNRRFSVSEDVSIGSQGDVVRLHSSNPSGVL